MKNQLFRTSKWSLSQKSGFDFIFLQIKTLADNTTENKKICGFNGSVTCSWSIHPLGSTWTEKDLDCQNVLEANPGFTIILILFVSAGFISVTLALAIGLSCLFCLGMLIKNICCSKKEQSNHEALRESEESERIELNLM